LSFSEIESRKLRSTQETLFYPSGLGCLQKGSTGLKSI